MAQIFQRLLLATERTEFDTGAERLALALAQRCQLPLGVVMPLVSNPEYEAVAPQLAAQADREAAAKLLPLREQARAAGVAIDLRVRRGADAWLEIVDDAQERGADLIVIRRRGQRGFLARMLVGEMVTQVVAHAPCNVLVVPRDAGLWTHRVLLAAEPGEAGATSLQLALAVAAECELPLHLLCSARGLPGRRVAPRTAWRRGGHRRSAGRRIRGADPERIPPPGCRPARAGPQRRRAPGHRPGRMCRAADPQPGIEEGRTDMSDALTYLLKARPEAMGHYFGFLKDAGKHLDPKTRNLISVITKVHAQTERGFRQYLGRALREGCTPVEVLDALLMAFPALGLAKIVWAVDIILAMDLPEFKPEAMHDPGQWHDVMAAAEA